METTTSTDTAQRLVAAIGDRDWPALEACLAPDVRFRALLPSVVRELSTAAETSERFGLWFDDVEAYELDGSTVEEMRDRVRVSYRIRGREEGAWVMVEQQAYLEVEDGRITDYSLVCSGFRPTEAP